ncbi:MAG: L,D-transpeptidase/peptidoglycan binding protein [Actinomycetota bacterium]|nr:L,D-transpeptidase/peptidoglycan binding protein [Actinomycetota bacterium]
MLRRLALTVFVVAALAPTLRGDAAPPVLIQPGVTLAGVPVGGMSNEQAQAALRPAFAEPVRLVYGDRRWRLQPTHFGGQVTIADGVLQALGAQAGAAVPLVPEVDEEEVSRFVNALDKRVSIAPKDADLKGLKGLRPQFTKEKVGLKVLRGLTVRRIVRALQSPQLRRIRVAVKVLEPARTVVNFGAVVVIRRGTNELRYYRGAQLMRKFGVATGQSVYPTPTGTFSIVDLQLNPWWLPPDSPWAAGKKPIPPGPGNPLGTRWMGLSAPGVGIHGTPDDASIGYSASHGCIRMHIPDAEWLFHHVKLGTPVVITD